jgi:hypothetical protein
MVRMRPLNAVVARAGREATTKRDVLECFMSFESIVAFPTGCQLY